MTLMSSQTFVRDTVMFFQRSTEFVRLLADGSLLRRHHNIEKPEQRVHQTSITLKRIYIDHPNRNPRILIIPHRAIDQSEKYNIQGNLIIRERMTHHDTTGIGTRQIYINGTRFFKTIPYHVISCTTRNRQGCRTEYIDTVILMKRSTPYLA
eukprot:TRINITY_DN11651_c0_g1_i2.p1 TRINITY_DN11651_c0_g1~~TRINITY_DN11651_c0_g1_i2.p1  ORF type:complete len:152 (+),score=0.02 TRINITY_DN11651_c0_g1_i2:82-537(+)